MVERVKLSFEWFIKGDKDGKRSGKSRFKEKNRYRTFTYPQTKDDWTNNNYIKLPKIGVVKFIQHRPLPDGFKLKTVAISLKADGWYVTLSLEDKSVPDTPTVDITPTEENSIGVDAGLEYFIACSDGTAKETPKFFRQAEEKLARLQAKVSLRKKGSTARRKLNQKIARQRKQWQFKIANELLDKADVIFVENLKVGNMIRRCKPKQDEDGKYLPNGQAAKSGFNKSAECTAAFLLELNSSRVGGFADAGIAGFLNEILPYKAAKAGKKVVKVNPAGTSQHCANCLNRVPQELSDRWHECYEWSLNAKRHKLRDS